MLPRIRENNVFYAFEGHTVIIKVLNPLHPPPPNMVSPPQFFGLAIPFKNDLYNANEVPSPFHFDYETGLLINIYSIVKSISRKLQLFRSFHFN